MQKEVFNIELNGSTITIKNNLDLDISTKIELISSSNQVVLFGEYSFKSLESRSFPIDSNSSDINNNYFVKVYMNGELTQEKTIYKTFDKVYLLISINESMNSRLIQSLLLYSKYQILNYTINYDSTLDNQNIKNIRVNEDLKSSIFLDSLDKGYKHVVFLESDIQVRTNIDNVFDIEQSSNGPIIERVSLDSNLASMVIFNQSHLELFSQCYSNNILDFISERSDIYSRFVNISLNILNENDVRFFYNIQNFTGNPIVNMNDYGLGQKNKSFIPYNKEDILFFKGVSDLEISDNINRIIEDQELVKNESEEYFRTKLIDFYSTISNTKSVIKEKVSLTIHYIDGPYVEVRNAGSKRFNISFIDKKTNYTVHSGNIGNNNWIRSNKSYFIDWKIICENEDERFEYDLNFENKNVFISFESSALGDNIAWIPYVEEFRKKHKCNVICSTFWNHLFESEYPEIRFSSRGSEVPNITACYRIGWFYDGDEPDLSRTPSEFRLKPLQKTSSDILGLDWEEVTPRIKMDKTIEKENIVSIAIHGTAQTKYWNNLDGWQKVVDYLREKGYRVILISREEDGYMGNFHPKGIEKLPHGSIEGVIEILQKSKLFIGIGSGLSWLSWATGTKTTIISGFSYPYTEPTINVIRILTPDDKCKGCFNDNRLDPGDWNWCPNHKGTDRHFECSKSITGEMVIEQIKEVI